MKDNIKTFTLAFALLFVISMPSYAQKSNSGKSAYTWEEIKRMCGVQVDTTQMKIIIAKEDSMYKAYLSRPKLSKTQTVPNWRSIMGPVANQDTDVCTYDCWAHSGAGLTEAQLHISISSNIGIFINATDIVTNTGWMQSCLQGGGPTPTVALNYIENSKAISYVSGSYPNLSGVRWGIISYNSTISGITAIKNALVNGPVTACFDVYQDFGTFFNNPNNRTAVYHWNHVAGTPQGHAVIIVSYDDAQQCWLCKNSWGTAWADAGYFRIGYGECVIDSWENCVATVNQSCYAKISPNLISSLTTALNYSYANNEYAYVYSGTNTLTGSVNPIPSTNTLVINSGTTINLNGYSIVSSGGTITVESGVSITCAELKTGSTINGIYPTVQSAVNASSSGQTIEISSGTFNEDVTINGISNLQIEGNSSSNTLITGTLTAYNCPGLYISSLNCYSMYFNNCNNSNFYYFGVGSTPSEIGISQYYCSNFQLAGEVYNSDCGLLDFTSDGYIKSMGNFFNNNTGVSSQASSNVMASGSQFCGSVNYDLEAVQNGYISAYDCYYNNSTPRIREFRGGTVYYLGANNCGSLLKRGIQTATQEYLPSDNKIQCIDPIAVEFENINLSYFSIIKKINDAAKENIISDKGKMYAEYKNVIKNFKKFVKKNPNSSLAKVAFTTAANSYWRYKEFDEMKDFLEETISDEKLDQLKGSAERFMIEYYREIKDFDSAIDTADAFIKKYENDKDLICDALFGKGLILSYDLKQPEKAAECFSAIVKDYPDNQIAVLAKNELKILGKGTKELQKENTVADKVELNISNYPNPFNPSTTINYQIPNTGYVTMKVFDILGREVVTLINEVKELGHYSTTFEGSRFTSGVYFVRITLTPQDGSKPFTKTMKIQLIK